MKKAFSFLSVLLKNVLAHIRRHEYDCKCSGSLQFRLKDSQTFNADSKSFRAASELRDDERLQQNSSQGGEHYDC